MGGKAAFADANGSGTTGVARSRKAFWKLRETDQYSDFGEPRKAFPIAPPEIFEAA